MKQPTSSAETTAAILAASVRKIAGPEAKPRTGQAELARNVTEAMATRGHQAGAAPTGTGKSFGYLVPAALAAIQGERTVVSTESLALQDQLVSKDLPVVTEACRELTGTAPSFAILKGWANYACAAKTAIAAAALAGTKTVPTSLVEAKQVASQSVSDTERAVFAKTISTTGDLAGVDRHHLADLIGWVADQTESGAVCDRHSYTKAIGYKEWTQVSLPSTECLGDDCPFTDRCRPAAARARAAAADIVVTNHAMCAVQAAKGAAVVIGSRRLGLFRHIIIDEAHALASNVRNQGSAEMSGQRIAATAKTCAHVLDVSDMRVSALLDDAVAIAATIDNAIVAVAPASHGQVRKLELDDSPLAGAVPLVTGWVVAMLAMTGKVKVAGAGTKTRVGVRRARSRLEALTADLVLATSGDVGVARWVEYPYSNPVSPVIKVSPVDVAGLLYARLWTSNVDFDDDDTPDVGEDEWLPSDGASPPRYPLSVTAVSATLPKPVVVDLGLAAARTAYESPFDDAYTNSRLFIPVVKRDSPGAGVLADGKLSYDKPRFVTSRHREWASPIISRLTAANNGSTLVLSATTAAGRFYVDELRKHNPRFNVYSQWDGEPAQQVVARWRDDLDSVLVGTRGLMTGVDAPGETCSLVVLDRIPRSASNPVDDARIDMIMERLELDRWGADRFVYVADAALLLEQAAGRLIRSTSDSGMVAVLDPRLSQRSVFTMSGSARQVYLASLGRFKKTVDDIGLAEQFLAEHRNVHTGKGAGYGRL